MFFTAQRKRKNVDCWYNWVKIKNTLCIISQSQNCLLYSEEFFLSALHWTISLIYTEKKVTISVCYKIVYNLHHALALRRHILLFSFASDHILNDWSYVCQLLEWYTATSNLDQIWTSIGQLVVITTRKSAQLNMNHIFWAHQSHNFLHPDGGQHHLQLQEGHHEGQLQKKNSWPPVMVCKRQCVPKRWATVTSRC
jgi:hypothetical protein